MPDPKAVFAYYHLGFDSEFRYRFRNLHHTAAQFQVTPDVLKAWLAEQHLDAETIKRLDYNLSRYHADAQELDLTAAPTEARAAFVARAWADFLVALAADTGGPPRDDIDWDALEQGET